jgi:hypothetical protein
MNAVLFPEVVRILKVPVGVSYTLASGCPNKAAFSCNVVGSKPDSFIYPALMRWLKGKQIYLFIYASIWC